MISREKADEEALEGVFVEQHADGGSTVKIRKSTGITAESLAAAMGGDLHFLDKKRRKAVVVTDIHNLPGDERHTNTLKELVGRVVGHIKSGGIQGIAAPDVTALMKWITDDIRLRNQRHRDATIQVARHVADLDAAARRKGGKEKIVKNPKAAATAIAKQSAAEMWPEAKRKGWTAERLHMELLRKGHAVKQDTVRKWLTSLRKTGAC